MGDRYRKYARKVPVLLALGVGLGVAQPARAQGVNTFVALPVARGEGIWRSQLRLALAGDDPSPADRERRSWVAPQTLALGITPRLTTFATLPVLVNGRLRSRTGTTRSDAAGGDLTLLVRYTPWWDDYAPLSTRRLALLAGVKLPTGADRLGTPTFDPLLGGVATWAFDRHEIDLDVLATVSTRRHGFRQGAALRYDLAYRYRLWPERFGRGQLQLNGILELNGRAADSDHDEGRRVRSSGGHRLFVAPGIQLVSRRFILEASLQLPLLQQLRGAQLDQEFVAVLGVRIPFTANW